MIYQLKIKLKGVTKPPVWRRVLIDANASFSTLHLLAQLAMGWGNCHLYQFGYKEYDGIQIGIPDEDYDDGRTIDANDVPIADFLNTENPKILYTYDFGDNWTHEITLEKQLPAVAGQLPRCTAGKGMCPPENCGGALEFENLKKSLENNTEFVKKVAENPDLNSLGDLTDDEEWLFYQISDNLLPLIHDGKIDFKSFDLEDTNELIYAVMKNHKERKSLGKYQIPEIEDDDNFSFPSDNEDESCDDDFGTALERMNLELIAKVMEENGHHLDVDAFLKAERIVSDMLKSVENAITSGQIVLPDDFLEEDEPQTAKKASKKTKKSGKKKK